METSGSLQRKELEEKEMLEERVLEWFSEFQLVLL